MEEQLKDKFVEYFNRLPEEVRNSFRSLDLDLFINQNEFTRPLEEWQKNTIVNLITLTFLGLSNPTMLLTKIKNVGEIARERAEKITESIEEEILVPHINILEQVYEVSNEHSGNRIPIADGVVPQHVSTQPQSTSSYREPIEAPTTKPQTEPVQQQKSDALDIFRKRLSGPVHTPAEKTVLVDKEEKQFTPKAPQSPMHDPYKESIE